MGPKTATVASPREAESGGTRTEIFVIDDDSATLAALQEVYASPGYDVRGFSNAIAALEELKRRSDAQSALCDLVVCDLVLPELDGMEFVRRLKAEGWEIPVILITGYGTTEVAVRALQEGAFDYITKPINLVELEVLSERAVRVERLKRGFEQLKRQMEGSWRRGELIGKSRPMQKLFSLVDQVSASSSNVLITGESGTGKEEVARMLHFRSPRKKNAFVAVNCSAIPDTLLESELFGHTKGAFTGASQARTGLFEEAQGGTIFLDEIGDMPMSVQGKVLRTVQEKKVRPLGGNRLRSVDVRIIAATNRDLKAQIKEGAFREDLYYRLCVIPIEIPPLRERREDIPLLAEHFLAHYAALNQKRISGFTQNAMAKLFQMRWTGNVRELQNTVERAVVLCPGEWIEDSDIQTESTTDLDPRLHGLFDNLVTLPQLEKEYLRYVLERTDHRKERAAKILGIDRKTLYRKEREYGLGRNKS